MQLTRSRLGLATLVLLSACSDPATRIPDPMSLSVPEGIDVRPFPEEGIPFECSGPSLDCTGGGCTPDHDDVVCCEESSADCVVTSAGSVTCEGGGCLIHGTSTGTRSCGPERPCWYVLDQSSGESDCPSGGCVFMQEGGTGDHTCSGGGCTYVVSQATGLYSCDGGDCLFLITGGTGEYTCTGGGCDFVMERATGEYTCTGGRCKFVADVALGNYSCGLDGCTFCEGAACEPCFGGECG